MKSGTGFGNDKENIMIVIRSLYGLKLSVAEWRSVCAETLLDLGHKPSRVYMDILIIPNTNPQTGKE